MLRTLPHRPALADALRVPYAFACERADFRLRHLRLPVYVIDFTQLYRLESIFLR